MPFVRVSGNLRLHYEEVGAGPPLILLDGVGGSWVWLKNVPALSQYFRTIILDVLGTGLSDKPPGPYSIPELARQLLQVISQLRAAPANLIGLSQGGQIALEAGAERPDLTGQIVTLGTLPGGVAQVLPAQSTTLRSVPLPFLSAHQNFLRRMSTALSPSYIATHPAELAQIERLSSAAPTPNHVRLAYTAAGATWPGIVGRAGRLRDRVLVMNGAADELSPVQNALILARQLPGAELQICPGTGHLCNFELPAQFNQRVLTFLLRG